MHNGIFRNTRHTNPQADLRNSTDEVRFFISCRKDSLYISVLVYLANETKASGIRVSKRISSPVSG